jgi:hypothetical protein
VRAIPVVSRAFAQVDATRCCMLVSDPTRDPTKSNGVDFVLMTVPDSSSSVIDGKHGTNHCNATSIVAVDFRSWQPTTKKRMLLAEEAEGKAEKSARIE